jgi:hypothetical protein
VACVGTQRKGKGNTRTYTTGDSRHRDACGRAWEVKTQSRQVKPVALITPSPL